MPARTSTTARRSSSASKARTTSTSKARGSGAARPRPAAARRTTAGRPQFKEPAALKRLARSLETADAALMELRSSAGRDLSLAAKDLYRDLNKFLSSAKRENRKLSTALRRDFEQASRQLERSQRQLRRPAGTTTARKPPAKRRTSS
jgi:hypothetical protein